MSWLNSIISVQGVSNFVGTFEIITALLLLLQLFWKRLSLIARGFGFSHFYYYAFLFIYHTWHVYHSGWIVISQCFHIKRYCAVGSIPSGFIKWLEVE